MLLFYNVSVVISDINKHTKVLLAEEVKKKKKKKKN